MHFSDSFGNADPLNVIFYFQRAAEITSIRPQTETFFITIHDIKLRELWGGRLRLQMFSKSFPILPKQSFPWNNIKEGKKDKNHNMHTYKQMFRTVNVFDSRKTIKPSCLTFS